MRTAIQVLVFFHFFMFSNVLNVSRLPASDPWASDAGRMLDEKILEFEINEQNLSTYLVRYEGEQTTFSEYGIFIDTFEGLLAKRNSDFRSERIFHLRKQHLFPPRIGILRKGGGLHFVSGRLDDSPVPQEITVEKLNLVSQSYELTPLHLVFATPLSVQSGYYGPLKTIASLRDKKLTACVRKGNSILCMFSLTDKHRLYHFVELAEDSFWMPKKVLFINDNRAAEKRGSLPSEEDLKSEAKVLAVSRGKWISPKPDLYVPSFLEFVDMEDGEMSKSMQIDFTWYDNRILTEDYFSKERLLEKHASEDFAKIPKAQSSLRLGSSALLQNSSR